MVMLNKRIEKALQKEEAETSKRYIAMGKKYNIPELVKAGYDEKKHSEIFKKLRRE